VFTDEKKELESKLSRSNPKSFAKPSSSSRHSETSRRQFETSRRQSQTSRRQETRVTRLSSRLSDKTDTKKIVETAKQKLTHLKNEDKVLDKLHKSSYSQEDKKEEKKAEEALFLEKVEEKPGDGKPVLVVKGVVPVLSSGTATASKAGSGVKETSQNMGVSNQGTSITAAAKPGNIMTISSSTKPVGGGVNKYGLPTTVRSSNLIDIKLKDKSDVLITIQPEESNTSGIKPEELNKTGVEPEDSQKTGNMPEKGIRPLNPAEAKNAGVTEKNDKGETTQAEDEGRISVEQFYSDYQFRL